MQKTIKILASSSLLLSAESTYLSNLFLVRYIVFKMCFLIDCETKISVNRNYLELSLFYYSTLSVNCPFPVCKIFLNIPSHSSAVNGVIKKSQKISKL